MKTHVNVLMVLALVASSALADEPRKAEWKPLFDGKSLAGWEHVGPGKMVVEDGLLKTEGGMGLLWYTRETLGDCVIKVVYKTSSKTSNSGVFIRVDGKPKDEWHAVHQGYEVQICDGTDEFHRTGAIYSMSKATASPGKVDEWNTMEIKLDGPRIEVTLNGVKVQDFNPSTAVIPERKKDYEPKRGPRPNSGYFGLQNHDDAAKGTGVSFKEVSVRPLQSKKTDAH